MKKVVASICVVFYFLLTSVSGYAAKEIPQLTDAVFDESHVINSQVVTTYNQQNKAWQQTETKPQAVFAVIDSYEAYGFDSIESAAQGFMEKWQIGSKEHNNGVLVLIANKERKIRIHTGYGAEGFLPDGLAGSWIRQNSDLLKHKEYNQVARNLLDKIKSVIGDNGQVVIDKDDEKIEELIGSTVGIAIIVFFILSSGQLGRFGRRYRRRRSRSWWYNYDYDDYDYGSHSSGWSSGSSGGGFSGGGGSSGGGGASGSF